MITLLQLLHLVGQKAGEYIPPQKTTGLGTASSLVCSSFVNSNLSPTSYESAAVLIEDSPTEALIGQQGFVRSSGLNKTGGVLNLAGPLTDPIPAGTTFSVYGRLPPLTALGGPSLQKAINLASQRFWIEDDLWFHGTDNAQMYPVQGDPWGGDNRYWWFDSASRIVGVYGPIEHGKVPPLYRGHVDWLADGEQIFLVFNNAPWKSGDRFKVRVYRPANTRLFRNGSWQDMLDPTDGLEALTDGTNANTRTLFTHAMAEVYQLLSEIHQGSQNVAEWMAKAQQWAAAASRLKHNRTPRDRRTGIVDLRPVVVGSYPQPTSWRGRW